ncbi:MULTISPECIES: DUF4406 domain-containing protein [Sphingobacterium]|uniref:DUF4406 domain-containing protein n=1 Tax=Sphingobacterium TaxID=28453 RepID=UPI00257E2B13|nr:MULTISPECIES: DUF4406 domain-containing protein [Sphingobacterium]
MEKPIVYIAGPVSGQPDLNRQAFYAAQEELNALGFDARNPHDFCIGIKSTDPSDPKFYKRGFQVLTECTDILLLDGWAYSNGAHVERDAAVLFKLGIFESIDDLKLKYSNEL